MRDDRARARARACADRHRRHKHGTGPDERVLSDVRLMFGVTIVIASHGSRTNVCPGANRRVSHITEMADPGAGPDDAVLYLCVVAYMGVRPDHRARPEVAERAHRRPLADPSRLHMRGNYLRAVSDPAVLEHSPGADHGIDADGCRPEKMGVRLDRRVLADRHFRVDIRGVGIDHGHPVEHPTPPDPRPQYRLGRRKLRPVVYADQFGRLGRDYRLHPSPGGHRCRDGVRDVKLPVFGRRQVLQEVPCHVRIHAVVTGVELVDGKRSVIRVRHLHDRRYTAVGSAYYASKAVRRAAFSGQQCDRRVGVDMGGEHGADRGGRDERHVRIGHQKM